MSLKIGSSTKGKFWGEREEKKIGRVKTSWEKPAGPAYNTFSHFK